jgi:hypothetical protein
MAPFRSPGKLANRRVSGEAPVSVRWARDAASRHQDGEAPAVNLGHLPGSHGRPRMKNPDNQHVAVEAPGRRPGHGA